MKYHISKNGDVNICKANKRSCRYGEDEHFDNETKAYEKVEEVLSQRFGNVQTLKKDSKSLKVKNKEEQNILKTVKQPAFTVDQLSKEIEDFENSKGRVSEKRPKITLSVYELKASLLNLNSMGDPYLDEKSLKVREHGGSIHATFKDFNNVPTVAYIDRSDGSIFIRDDAEEIEEDDRLILRFKKGNLSDSDLKSPMKVSNAIADLLDESDEIKDWDSEEDAVEAAYLSYEHYRINEALRNNTASESLKRSIESIESKDKLNENIVVYRGLRAIGADVSKGLSEGSYRDGGLLSTSTDPKTALGFSGNREGSTILRIEIPKGTGCWNVGGEENEIILPRNFDLSKARVLKLNERIDA